VCHDRLPLPAHGDLHSCSEGRTVLGATCQVRCEEGYVPAHRALMCASVQPPAELPVRLIDAEGRTHNEAPPDAWPRCIPLLSDASHVSLQVLPPSAVTAPLAPLPRPVLPFATLLADEQVADQRGRAALCSMLRAAAELDAFNPLLRNPCDSSPRDTPRIQRLWPRRYSADKSGIVHWLDTGAALNRSASSYVWPPPVLILNLDWRVARLHAAVAQLLAAGYPVRRIHRMRAVRGEAAYLGFFYSWFQIMDWATQQNMRGAFHTTTLGRWRVGACGV
jgi:hypothetical protein